MCQRTTNLLSRGGVNVRPPGSCCACCKRDVMQEGGFVFMTVWPACCHPCICAGWVCRAVRWQCMCDPAAGGVSIDKT